MAEPPKCTTANDSAVAFEQESHAMNEHDAETRQFLALVNAGHARMAMLLAAMRTKLAMRALTLIGMVTVLTVSWLLEVPQSVASAILARFGW